MSAATTEVRLLAKEARELLADTRGEYDLPPSFAALCTAVTGLADAVVFLADDIEATLRVVASRTEHLA